MTKEGHADKSPKGKKPGKRRSFRSLFWGSSKALYFKDPLRVFFSGLYFASGIFLIVTIIGFESSWWLYGALVLNIALFFTTTTVQLFDPNRSETRSETAEEELERLNSDPVVGHFGRSFQEMLDNEFIAGSHEGIIDECQRKRRVHLTLIVINFLFLACTFVVIFLLMTYKSVHPNSRVYNESGATIVIPSDEANQLCALPAENRRGIELTCEVTGAFFYLIRPESAGEAECYRAWPRERKFLEGPGFCFVRLDLSRSEIGLFSIYSSLIPLSTISQGAKDMGYGYIVQSGFVDFVYVVIAFAVVMYMFLLIIFLTSRLSEFDPETALQQLDRCYTRRFLEVRIISNPNLPLTGPH